VPGDLETWTKEWGGKIYISSGSTHSRGVAILIPNGMDYEINSCLTDDYGRYILLDGIFNGYELTLLNIYAPTAGKNSEQLKFLDELTPCLQKYSYKLILGGDFNTHLGELDNYKSNMHISNFARRLITMMEDLDMCDIYRILNPDTRRYTWRRLTTNGLQQTRLDYILIPNNMIYQINKVDIGHSLYSDHSPVSIHLEEKTENIRGRGYWKFNSSLLQDNDYVTKINELLDREIPRHDHLENKGLAWDTIKMLVRSETVNYSSHKSKQRREQESKLLEEYKTIETNMTEQPDDNTRQQYMTVIKELEMINNERTRGCQIRAKASHIEYNEHNSSYFFAKEKNNAMKKNISTIQLDDGSKVTQQDKILKCQQKFYERLYTEPENVCQYAQQEAEQNFFNTEALPKLDEDEKNLIDLPITLDEIAHAIKELPNNRSPGTDGLPIEFYKFFWKKIQNIVLNSIEYAIQNGQMSVDQRRGILSLIPKKDKDIRFLKNWRPLTLLNCDYKIFAKAMSSRLQKVIPTLVSDDQSGCRKGYSTYRNIRSTVDIIAYTNEQKLHGILTYIDFEKAFDTVRWNFMHKVLEKMNFGSYFRNCVKTMYKDIKSCVMNNGFASAYFSPTRGIRQGCPISANIFILIVEILAIAIRSNPDIVGIIINGKEFKISQYADDTCLFLADQNSLKKVLQDFESFKNCSGLRVNMDKSEAIWIGASSNFRHKPYGLKWTRGATCLGIYITNDLQTISEVNFKEKMQKIQDLLKLWAFRKLTLKGKVQIVNTLILPQVLYPCSVIHMPAKYIDMYNKVIMDFIWDNKPAKVKYKTMINKIEEGGLKLQDLECKIKSLKFKWIKNIIDVEYKSPWKSYLNSKFVMDVEAMPYYQMNPNNFPVFNDDFYNDMFNTWSNIHFKEPEDNEAICKQIIWYNDYIKVEGKGICYKSWREHNIEFIQDIINNKGEILSQKELEAKYNLNCKYLEYLSILTAIPSKWKKN
jgi:exonuclease III